MDLVKQFHKENGGKCVVSMEPSPLVVYANGASREIDPNGRMDDPPRNKFLRLSIIMRYWEAHVRQAEQEFHNARNDYVGYPSSGSESAEEVEARLKKLKANVMKYREKVAEIYFERQKTREAREERKQMKADSQLASRAVGIKASALRIKI